MSPRWLPLYLLGIGALTLFPFQPAECASPGWAFRMGRVDFTANLVAFVPIGVALSRWPLLRALAAAFALSLGIELLQAYLPRQQDVGDLISNTSGALVGHGLAGVWTRRWDGPLLRPVTRRVLLGAATPVLLLAAVAQAIAAPSNDLSNWVSFPFAIGSSGKGDRPWQGEISDLRLFDRALEPMETATSEPDAAVPPLWAEGGPILWLRFAPDEVTGRIDGPVGPVRYAPAIGRPRVVDEAGLRLLPSGIVLESWVADHVVEILAKAGAFTLDLHLRSAVERQRGPAHIIELGDGRFRNLLLAQRGSALVARIRTPANGRRGFVAEAETDQGVMTTEPQHVQLSYDGTRAVIRIDGVCEHTLHMAVANARPLMGHFLGVALVGGTALPTLAIGWRRRGGARLALALAAGAASWSWLGGCGLWSHLADYTPIALALGILTLLACLPLLLDRPVAGEDARALAPDDRRET